MELIKSHHPHKPAMCEIALRLQAPTSAKSPPLYCIISHTRSEEMHFLLQLLSARPGERPCSLQELPLAALLPDADKETVLGKSITPQFTPPVSVHTHITRTCCRARSQPPCEMDSANAISTTMTSFQSNLQKPIIFQLAIWARYEKKVITDNF
jgi:hypothetical protein